MIAPTYKHIVRPSPIRCGTLNTPLTTNTIGLGSWT